MAKHVQTRNALDVRSMTDAELDRRLTANIRRGAVLWQEIARRKALLEIPRRRNLYPSP